MPHNPYQLTRGYDRERPKLWWVLGFECGPMGPYKTKEEAQDDARGVEKFYKNNKQLWADRLENERENEYSLGCPEPTQGDLF